MNRPRLSFWTVLAVFVVAIVLLGGGFGAGVALDRNNMLPGSVALEPQSVASTFSPFWQAWNIVRQDYVDRSAVDPTKLTQGAIDGMVTSLGDVDHSRYLTANELKQEQESLAGQLEGIGAEMVQQAGMPTILAPIAGSPAERAGLRPGDVITRVNGQDISGLSLSQVVNLVRGPAGTSVTLTIVHKGSSTPVNVTIVRAKINVPTVTWAMLPGTTTADVLINQFAQDTTDKLVSAIKDLKAAGATSIILDLRNNPGGYEDQAIGVASQFLKSGNVLLTQDATGKRTPTPVQPGGIATDIPLVVLVNDGTASSSEIVAGAIQDHKRGELVGTTTFGTGTLLSTFNLSDGSALLLGTAEWLTPNGRVIWHKGITPDIVVDLPPNALPLIPETETNMTPQQLQASQDTQVLRALEVLGGSGSKS
ncbi:MAG: S41 family peptidase [Chloroflexi bacterium]|nr:S41 family peptidase [Chloroflexota bacterium]